MYQNTKSERRAELTVAFHHLLLTLRSSGGRGCIRLMEKVCVPEHFVTEQRQSVIICTAAN